MFRCVAAPSEPHYPADLAKLGFKFKDGQFLDGHGAHFKYFHTDNHRVNEVRKEAMHECAREVVVEELRKFDVHELFLTGPSGSTPTTQRPDGPHMKILATEVSKLRSKKDVIVVCGEAAAATQDAGIWAYRVLMREGGVERGSAVGLAARIAAYGQLQRQDDFELVEGEGAVATAQLDVNDGQKQTDETTPGLVILNGGQRLYSHIDNKCMTLSTWQARPLATVADVQYEINEKHNVIPGHYPSFKHISTVFGHILPQVLRSDARIYVICIGDGAKAAIDYFDLKFIGDSTTGLASQLEAVALIEPDHEPEHIISEPLTNFLAVRGKSWIQSNLPFNKLVQTPPPVKPIVDYVSGLEDAGVATAAQALLDAVVAAAEPDYTTVRVAEATACNANGASMEENAKVGGVMDGQDDNTEDWGAWGAFVDVKDEAYEQHAQLQVSCPTFSAGNCDGISETVFPKVMDEVLEFFLEKKAEAEKYEALREAARDG